MPSILDTTKQFWNILNMYPEIHSPQLQERIDTFVLHADVNAFFQMQKGLFDFATPYFLDDERISVLMYGLDGKKIGLSIGREYESTLIFHPEGFDMIWGIKRGYPVLHVVSRQAYRDGILRRADPLKLVLTRKIKIRKLATLARWALPFWHIFIDDSLYEKFLGYQDEVEEWITAELTRLGY
jgi:hypothetical protein